MRHALPILLAVACAVSVLEAVAATQSGNSIPNATAVPSEEPAPKSPGLRTGDWEYATPQMIPLTPQPVRSWGGAMQPGPRNVHVSPPHGSLVTGGARLNEPGRM
jgi:hypothetical protein